MTEHRYRIGQHLRVLVCPTGGQHNGQTGVVIDTYARIVRVEMPSGERCWPYRVERVDDEAGPETGSHRASSN
jgi:hypothetical protein